MNSHSLRLLVSALSLVLLASFALPPTGSQMARPRRYRVADETGLPVRWTKKPASPGESAARAAQKHSGHLGRCHIR